MNVAKKMSSKDCCNECYTCCCECRQMCLQTMQMCLSKGGKYADAKVQYTTVNRDDMMCVAD